MIEAPSFRSGKAFCTVKRPSYIDVEEFVECSSVIFPEEQIQQRRR